MKLMTSAEAAMSKEPSGNGRLMASACWNFARAPAGPRDACSTCASDGSIPTTDAGSHRSSSASVRIPVPQPTSSHLTPRGGWIQRRKCAATARLQRPMKLS